MDESLRGYVQELQKKGLHHDDIVAVLTEAGWSRLDALSALRGEAMPLPPVPEYAAAAPAKNHPLGAQHGSREPVAVVQNFSVRGFEYLILFLTLWATAFAIGGLAHSFVNDLFSKASGDYVYGDTNPFNGFAVTLLIITFPIFAYMFLRLKKAEIKEPSLHSDPSRRRLTQMTQLVSFLMGMIYIAYFVYSVIVPDRYSDEPMLAQNFLHTLITVIIAGGIFLYYWRDDHKKEQ